MKRLFSMIILAVLICLSGCSKTSESKTELIVFAASSMTESLTDIAQRYAKVNPNVKLTFNFDSSGTLKTQIEEGASCDIFISASQKPMNEFEYIIEESRFDLLENKITLVVPKDNPKNINSFEDMVSHLNSGDILLAIGNSDVPVGEYTLEIFDYYNLDMNQLDNSGCLTYGSNAKEVTTQVSENLVDCGIVYQTDAATAKLTVVDTANKQMCGDVIYPAAIINTTSDIDVAVSFLDYLKGDEASQIFKNYGFTPVS
ncbi:MAG: molybdate ABC transporter substrate-binding protein [Ruminococcus sp.]|nr:molybdate ABC transporter substrate-binding protein [Ruminococcus sp.]